MRGARHVKNAAIVVAAGSGTRAAGKDAAVPKQYRPLAGRMVLAHCLEAFSAHPAISDILVVIRPGDEPLYEEAVRGLQARLLPPVHGGATRQQSVLNGLRALSALHPDTVLIHDAARPFITIATISDILARLDHVPGAIAATPLSDTLKRGADGLVAQTIDRTGLWCAQTPQGFRYCEILAAHEAAAAAGRSDFSDDAAIAEWRGLRVALVDSPAANWKITKADDFARAEAQMRQSHAEEIARAPMGESRAATGFDVHAFEAGDHVTLCGVKIPHTHGLRGHSDADAPLHALTDALLGTIGAGDIGDHFPPSDPQWRGADSGIFLKHARDLIARRGGRIVNVDITILAERPRIAPHRDAMRARVAELLGIGVDRVGLKATTTEGLGFTGRREGLASLATATVFLPFEPGG